MVSIVIVSHSPDLAKGLLSLVNQMTQGKVKIAIAAGVDDPENPIGTDAIAVMTAIEEVYSPEGVVVLVDMGSAILSTDMALELLGDEIAANVYVCAAPVVEGAISASVAAAAGMKIEDVLQEAHSAISAKYQILEQAEKLPGSSNTKSQQNPIVDTEVLDTAIEFEWHVKNAHGIHARPASAIVAAVSPFNADVWLSCHGKTSNAKSINSIALLGVKMGDSLICHARGIEAEDALQAFKTLAQNNFNEQLKEKNIAQEVKEDVAQKVVQVPQDGSLYGIGASEGIGIAPIWRYQITMPKPTERDSLGYEQEWQLFENARKVAQKEILELATKTAQSVSQSDSEIFIAHNQMLTDPELDQKIDLLLKEKENIECAWSRVIEETAKAYKNSDSEYMQARAKDVYDLGQRVMILLSGHEKSEIAVKTPVILLAHDLSPSDTALLDPQFIKGIILEQGGTTSHSAIIARALNIPAVVGIAGICNEDVEGKVALIDGGSGAVCLSPSKAQIKKAQKDIEEKQRQKLHAQQFMLEKAATKDGHRIEVFANVASAEDATLALENGAEGIGLVRSEFLFTDKTEAPQEDVQYEIYSQIAKALKGAPVIIRTLDIGGDKPLDFLKQKAEENPFLGCRGIRLCFQNIDVFTVQLKALLRACATYPNIKIMFPMVSTVEEVIEVKSLLNTCYQNLVEKRIPAVVPEIGIMIEVPSAVANAEQLAKHVSFFSIGTNDLTQYVMAADRGNDSVSYLISPLQPAVLRMIDATVRAAQKAHIPVGICGEMAGDSKITELLIGLGVSELSMSSTRIANVKQKVRDIDCVEAQSLASTIIRAETLEQVQKMI